MGSRRRQRRIQLDRAGIAERTGMTIGTVNHWYLRRARTGFPDKADTDPDGRDWWWKEDIDTFHTEHLARRAATLTHVDRRGDPDDLLTAPHAAKVLGYRNHRSLPDQLLHHPDHAETLPSGRLRRYWKRATVWDYADGRPLRHSTGRPAGTSTAARQPHPYADDPRLDAALALLAETGADGGSHAGLGTELARRLQIGERTGQRLIAAALGRRTASTSQATVRHRRRGIRD
ncbi:MAG: hypothetical protein J2P15_12455 [Micromonosporaceae bacterium]|nr:hypothetical protein [Micromonosporaceae bacterium]